MCLVLCSYSKVFSLYRWCWHQLVIFSSFVVWIVDWFILYLYASPVFCCSIVKATANPRLLFMARGLLFDIWGSVGGEVWLGMVVMVCLSLLLLLDWMIPTGEYRQILGWMLLPMLRWRQETCTELWSLPTHHITTVTRQLNHSTQN